jgi:putative peptide zinc metalloprotease protein
VFARPVVILLWAVSLAGLPAFFYVTRRGDLSVLQGASGTIGWGLVGLLAAQVFAVFAHESAHALTTKHYGRTIRRGGVGLYFGMVTFFMDTTDIWMEPRGPRLAVTWAGPFSGYSWAAWACCSPRPLRGPGWPTSSRPFAVACRP